MSFKTSRFGGWTLPTLYIVKMNWGAIPQLYRNPARGLQDRVYTGPLAEPADEAPPIRDKQEGAWRVPS